MIALQAGAWARTATLALAVAALMEGAAARADRYGPWAEDLLLRPGLGAGELAELVKWTFYALAAFVGGWAFLRFRMHFDAPEPGGLITPVVGIAFAVALATTPALIEALLEGLAIGHEPPFWRVE